MVEVGHEVKVVRNDAISLSEIKTLNPELLVISPGPCTPDEAGISLSVIEEFSGKMPILGVCLGHQAIAQHFGARVERAAKVMHGKVSTVKHFGHEMFADIKQNFDVTRYHSLVVNRASLPEELIVTAQTVNSDSTAGDIMALAHRNLPIWGVQFHPESHLTEYGHKLLANIINLGLKQSK